MQLTHTQRGYLFHLLRSVTLPDVNMVASIRAIELRPRNPCAPHATPSTRVELPANDAGDAWG